jgi:hypothetical protein
MVSEITRKIIELKLENLAAYARLMEITKKEILTELDIARSEVWTDGEAEFPLGENLDIFIANFNHSTRIGYWDYASLVKDWQIKTMQFNKEAGKWE